MTNKLPLKPNEKIIFALRSLYDSYGYSLYKMSKFEEYDLYSGNKDFLVSDGVITFTDTNGKLMALKPDVTLSLIKNTSGGSDSAQKLYYNENVYRVSAGTHGFKEIMQAGLECIGAVDPFCVCEVLTLAALSLKAVSENFVLAVSDLGILSEVMESAGVGDSDRAELFGLIGEKNQHGIAKFCAGKGIAEESAALLKKLASFHASPEKGMTELKELLAGAVDPATFAGFASAVTGVKEFGERIVIDFSVVDNINYYNGIVFKGFIEGVPTGVLSGGRYDALMHRMNRNTGAIGFAVYLDMLDILNVPTDETDVDTVLLYDGTADAAELKKTADLLRKQGSVLVTAKIPAGLRYGKLVRYGTEKEKTDENDA